MNLVKLNGLNRRTISVCAMHILFLEEHELEGNLVTNVHFSNGKWATASHPLDEVQALVSKSPFEKSEEDVEKEDNEQIERWRRQAKARRKAQLEVDEALRLAGPSLKSKSYHKEEFADGSGKLTIHFEPKEISGDSE